MQKILYYFLIGIIGLNVENSYGEDLLAPGEANEASGKATLTPSGELTPGTPVTQSEKTIEDFNVGLIAREPISQEIGIVGKKKLAKPPTVMGKSIFIEIPYWPTVNGIWDEIKTQHVAFHNYGKWNEWQSRPNNWEAGAICTCTSMVLEHYGTKYSPREILKNASGASYDPNQCTTDFYNDQWYTAIVQALKTKGYQWDFKVLRNDHTQFQKELDAIKTSLDKGNPSIISVSIPPVNQYAKWHAVVVQGYDEKDQVIYIIDPTISSPGERVISYKNFEKIWHTQDGTGMRYIMITSLKQ